MPARAVARGHPPGRCPARPADRPPIQGGRPPGGLPPGRGPRGRLRRAHPATLRETGERPHRCFRLRSVRGRPRRRHQAGSGPGAGPSASLPPGAVAFERLDRVGGAGGLELADRRALRADLALVDPDGSDHAVDQAAVRRPFPHGARAGTWTGPRGTGCCRSRSPRPDSSRRPGAAGRADTTHRRHRRNRGGSRSRAHSRGRTPGRSPGRSRRSRGRTHAADGLRRFSR